ncbi:diaminopimelate decarboxylase [Noviherbaspirillum humi]|uniref:Diaminopimelate decarboxylase n=1 Tax=Noviherbaspirillum humi TaxID=1688639 RepID=A0A239HLI8_9BURK|nr:diaminopimelate decarboxylase [Noviherbaspirillum humi]
MPPQFDIIDDCLHVGGLSILRVAGRTGSTPFFAYDRQLVSERVQQVREVMAPSMKLHYSIKANPMPALVQHLSGLVDGFDVASGGELSIALDTPVPPACINFTGPGKRVEELRRALYADVIVHVESERELDTVAKLARELGLSPRVMLRVNPDFSLRASGMRMGGGPKPFGIDAESIPEVMKKMETMQIECLGFHIYSGSQNLAASALIEEKKQVFDLAMELARHGSQPLKYLNIGGGFGIPYFPGELPLDLIPMRDFFREKCGSLAQKHPGVEVILELGRYLVGEAGVYVARVIDRKVSRGKVFLITDGGMHHHLAASGNLGQVIRKNYPVAIANRMRGKVHENVTVTGPLCTPLDILADNVPLPEAEVGDLVVVFQSGAYGRSASPQDFLSHPSAVEVLL